MPSSEQKKNMQKLTIIMPAFNEEQSVKDVLTILYKECGDIIEEIIVIDDGSTDLTAIQVQQSNATLIQHKTNKGYGASLKTGIKAAKTEFVMTMDSDGQHRPEDVRALWENRGDYDMVIGARTEILHSPLWRMPGKWFLTYLANYITKYQIPDLNSGLRLMHRETVLKYSHICPNGFSFSTTITIALLKRGYAVNFFPIHVHKRQGKSTVSIKTGFETLLLTLRLAVLFAPLRIFIPLSIAMGVIGIAWGIPYLIKLRGLSIGALLFVTSSLWFFSLGLISDQISQLRLEKFE